MTVQSAASGQIAGHIVECYGIKGYMLLTSIHEEIHTLPLLSQHKMFVIYGITRFALAACTHTKLVTFTADQHCQVIARALIQFNVLT